MEHTTVNSKFIATEPFGKGGEKGEQLVWEAICVAFRDRDCLAYWHYPIFSQSGNYRREPDILIADAQLGLIVIEVKGIRIEQIVNIQGHRWQYQNFYTTEGSPYQQAEDQLFSLMAYRDREPSLKSQIQGRALIALPHITSQEWQQRGFFNLPTSPPILFKEHVIKPHLDPSECLKIIQSTPSLTPGKPLSPSQWQLLLSLLGGTPLYTQTPHPVLTRDKTRGILIQQRRQQIPPLDLQQERIAKQIPPGLQRIRGIAGSGKTVLLCQKAAQIHLKYPAWDVAVVFFSHSLYQPIVAQIDQWLRYFSNNQQGYNPDSKLQVLPAWGGKKPGLYSLLCEKARVHCLTVKDVQERGNYNPTELLALACTHLLKSAPIPPGFDAILIDEGQDFLVKDELKYQGKQPFYWLAYQALHPVDIKQPEQRRLIWAYDELQSLDTIKSPDGSELFGEELGHLVTGEYRNGIQKTEILFHSHRTPHLILTAAHALCLGLLRPQGMLTVISRLKDWEAIGYSLVNTDNSNWEGIEQELLPQQKVTLQREKVRFQIPLREDDTINFQAYETRQEELSALATHLRHNLRYEGLRPSQEILVLILGSSYEAKQLQKQTAKFLLAQGLDIFIPGYPQCNLIQTEQYYPERFWCEGAITVSNLDQSKGNEADMVYVIGLDEVAKNESNLQLRNQLFVALTRSRGWVNLSGIGTYPFYREVQKVIASRDTFTFTHHHSPQREITVTQAGELRKRYSQGHRNFQNINLQGSNLAGINLTGANLIQANLSGVNFSRANLAETKLVIANLKGANLTQTNLRKAKLVGAMLQNAILNGADLSYADLSNADLTNTQLVGTKLDHANLEGAIFDEGCSIVNGSIV